MFVDGAKNHVNILGSSAPSKVAAFNVLLAEDKPPENPFAKPLDDFESRFEYYDDAMDYEPQPPDELEEEEWLMQMSGLAVNACHSSTPPQFAASSASNQQPVLPFLPTPSPTEDRPSGLQGQAPANEIPVVGEARSAEVSPEEPPRKKRRLHGKQKPPDEIQGDVPADDLPPLITDQELQD